MTDQSKCDITNYKIQIMKCNMHSNILQIKIKMALHLFHAHLNHAISFKVALALWKRMISCDKLHWKPGKIYIADVVDSNHTVI